MSFALDADQDAWLGGSDPEPKASDKSSDGETDNPEPQAQAPDQSTKEFDVNRELADTEAERDRYLKEYEALQGRLKSHMDAWRSTNEALSKGLEQQLQQPLPEVPQPAQVNPPPDLKQQQQKQGLRALGFAAVAIPLAMIFGRRGHMASWNALGALGAGLKAFKRADDARMHEAYDQWSVNAQYAKQQAQERLQYYKEILQHQELGISRQMDLMKLVAQRFHDPVMEDQAEAKSLQGVLNNLAKKEQLLQKYGRAQKAVGDASLDNLRKSEMGREYQGLIMGEGGQDPYSSMEAWRAAQKLYPWKKFMEERKKAESGKEDLAFPGQPHKKSGFSIGEGSQSPADDPLGILGGGGSGGGGMTDQQKADANAILGGQ